MDYLICGLCAVAAALVLGMFPHSPLIKLFLLPGVFLVFAYAAQKVMQAISEHSSSHDASTSQETS